MTVTKAGPIAAPTSAASDQMLCAMPFAAICTVPNSAVMLLSATLMSWNRPFSTPFGTATRRMRQSMPPSQRRISRSRYATALFLPKQNTVTATAVKMRDRSVG